MQTLTNPADIANRYQTYFQRKLLPKLVYNLVMDQFGDHVDLPKNVGAKTMRFYRKRQADSSQVSTLTEGVALATYTEVTTGYVDVTLAQLGQITKLSDILQWTDIFNWLEQSIDTMGDDAAKKCDDIIRAAIVLAMLNSNTLNGFERFCGVPSTANSANDFATLAALPANQTQWTRNAGLGAVTQLKVNKVPMSGGRYVAAVAPAVVHDIRKDDALLKLMQYSKPEMMFNREMFTLDGARYVEHDNAHQETVYGTYLSTGAVYTTMYIGRNAYGVPKLAGTSSPMAPQVVINNKAEKVDLLNQYALAGWKAYYQAFVQQTNLTGDPFRIALLRSQSTFNSNQ